MARIKILTSPAYSWYYGADEISFEKRGAIFVHSCNKFAGGINPILISSLDGIYANLGCLLFRGWLYQTNQ